MSVLHGRKIGQRSGGQRDRIVTPATVSDTSPVGMSHDNIPEGLGGVSEVVLSVEDTVTPLVASEAEPTIWQDSILQDLDPTMFLDRCHHLLPDRLSEATDDRVVVVEVLSSTLVVVPDREHRRLELVEELCAFTDVVEVVIGCIGLVGVAQ